MRVRSKPFFSDAHERVGAPEPLQGLLPEDLEAVTTVTEKKGLYCLDATFRHPGFRCDPFLPETCKARTHCGWYKCLPMHFGSEASHLSSGPRWLRGFQSSLDSPLPFCLPTLFPFRFPTLFPFLTSTQILGPKRARTLASPGDFPGNKLA